MAGRSVTFARGQLIADRSENGFAFLRLQLAPKQEHFPIGSQIEQILRRDLPGHDGPGNVSPTEIRDELSELADAHPLHLVGELRDSLIGFVDERSDHDLLHPSRVEQLQQGDADKRRCRR